MRRLRGARRAGRTPLLLAWVAGAGVGVGLAVVGAGCERKPAAPVTPSNPTGPTAPTAPTAPMPGSATPSSSPAVGENKTSVPTVPAAGAAATAAQPAASATSAAAAEQPIPAGPLSDEQVERLAKALPDWDRKLQAERGSAENRLAASDGASERMEGWARGAGFSGYREFWSLYTRVTPIYQALARQKSIEEESGRQIRELERVLSDPASSTDTKEAIGAQIAELRAANLGKDYLNDFKPEEILAVKKRFEAIAPYFIRK